MTLGRLLFAGVSLIFALVLAGVEAIAVRNAQRYLQEQLAAHAQETATSLALTLGAVLTDPDPVLAGTVINPVFDRGNYESVRFVSLKGADIVARRIARLDRDAPAWFMGLFPLEAPGGEALVSAGWRQLGRVMVQVHPGLAYAQLWRSAQATLGWLALLYALALFATARVLAGILRPLRAVEQAAEAISRREFRAVEAKTRTRELARVIAAMNALSGKVREAIEQESARAERLLAEAYQDPVTHVFNRRGFRQRLEALLEGDTGIDSGALAIFAVRGLEELNRAEGAAAGDALLRAAGEAVAGEFEGRAPLVGRHEGASFIALRTGIDRAGAERWAREATARAAARRATVVAGVAHFALARPAIERLEHSARAALQRALQHGAPLEAAAFDTEALFLTDADWRYRIEAAAAAGEIALLGQKVFALPGREVLHVELTLALAEKGAAMVPAGAFMPAATRLGLLVRLDRAVAERLPALARRTAAEGLRYAVNVSGRSLGDAEYLAALKALLARESGLAARLVLEAPSYAVAADPAAAERFARELRAAGAEFALDDVDLSPASLALARRLLPRYVKLAPAFARDIAAHTDARFLFESLIAILRPLEVAVIAKGIEDPAAVDELARAGAGGYQGYAGDRPVPVG